MLTDPSLNHQPNTVLRNDCHAVKSAFMMYHKVVPRNHLTKCNHKKNTQVVTAERNELTVKQPLLDSKSLNDWYDVDRPVTKQTNEYEFNI